ncbi:hypothetical protein [Cytobacillus sp. IB215665]|uniref:hypothetical protein n=1 Tax=Cytobacillus sp. IB215665 TaxID=3097357 RepID=UPI002A142D4A|nr:hypothetical protein [Cytobacillus sp. IB215665]MDX8367693.1 hypothetical protein [Cytobacillus sp. IB215665]
MACILENIISDYELSKALIRVTNNGGTHVAVRRNNFNNGNIKDYEYVSILNNVDEKKINTYLKKLKWVCGEYVYTDDGKMLTAYCIVIED